MKAAVERRPTLPLLSVPPARDRALAEALAAIAAHWEALDSDYAREDWLAALWATSAKLGERRGGVAAVPEEEGD